MDNQNSTSDDDEIGWTLPTAAILVISMAAYVALIVIALMIRKCLISQGICGDCFPKYFSSDCCRCFRNCGQACNCHLPTVDNCLDAICPARQRLNCIELLICEWASFRLCQEGATYTCGSGDCSCTCEAPHCESINCLCCEISFRNVAAG